MYDPKQLLAMNLKKKPDCRGWKGKKTDKESKLLLLSLKTWTQVWLSHDDFVALDKPKTNHSLPSYKERTKLLAFSILKGGWKDEEIKMTRTIFSRNIHLSLHLREQVWNAYWMPGPVLGAYKWNGQKIIIGIIMKSVLLVIHLIIQLELTEGLWCSKDCAR